MRAVAWVIVLLLCILHAGAPLACDSIELARTERAAAQAEDNAGAMTLERAGLIYLLEADCYVLPEGWGRGQLSFRVNNFIPDFEALPDEPLDERYEDLGVQILHLFPQGTRDLAQSVYASRNSRVLWYRGGTVAPAYARGHQPLPIRVEEWSEAHGFGTVPTRNDRALEGAFHAMAMPDGISTFSQWWRLSTKIVGRYDLLLQNFLFRFRAATAPPVSGIPFRVKGHDAQEIVVRYASASAGFGGAVRLCFGSCELLTLGIELLPTRDLTFLIAMLFGAEE